MSKKNIIKCVSVLFTFLVIGMPTLKAVNVLNILEGYGRDSIATFSTQHAQSEAARIFNLLLEANGEVTAEKAEEQLNKSTSSTMRSYLCVILADYAFVNYNFDSGLRYMKRAVDEYDPIRNDSYYQLVLARAQKAILESPGKIKESKKSVLEDYSPRVIVKEPRVKKVNLKEEKEAQDIAAESTPSKSDNSKVIVTVSPEINKKPVQKEIKSTMVNPVVQAPKAVNYRMQIGAFGVQENALRKQAYFEEKGYPVKIEIRETSSKPLYIVQVGEFETYQEAKRGLSRFKSKYPAEEGIVVKVK